MLKKRPFLVTLWAIWIKPRLKIRYIDIRFHREHGKDDQGKILLQIVDDFDREYWVRMSPWRYRLFKLFQRWTTDEQRKLRLVTGQYAVISALLKGIGALTGLAVLVWIGEIRQTKREPKVVQKTLFLVLDRLRIKPCSVYWNGTCPPAHNKAKTRLVWIEYYLSCWWCFPLPAMSKLAAVQGE